MTHLDSLLTPALVGLGKPRKQAVECVGAGPRTSIRHSITRLQQKLVRTPSVVSSHDVVRTVVTVRCDTMRLATVRFIGPRGDTRTAGLNFCRFLTGWSVVRTLLKYPQKSFRSLCVSFRSFAPFIHADEPKRRSGPDVVQVNQGFVSE